MNRKTLVALGIALLASTSAHAIDAKYRKLLERSGCTQVTESEGCDIHKTKAENAKAGFGSAAPAQSDGATAQTPYAGQWVAKGPTGQTVSTIRIDDKEHVWVNGKPVKAKRSDGALVFRQGFVTYTIQGDRRLKGEDTWHDSDVNSTGPILPE
jgi:hypothetical protein